MKLISPFSTAAVIGLLSLTSAHAQAPMISLLFEDAPLGVVTSSTFEGWSVSDGTNRVVDVITDSDDYFGKGSSAHMLRFARLADGAGTMSFRAVNAFTPSPLITVSFTMYEPNITGTGALGLYFGRNIPGSTDLGGYITLRNGSASNYTGGTGTGSYTMDAAHRFDIVLNNAASSATYSEGTLSAESFDMWVDGVRVLENAQFSTTSSSYTGNISSIQFIYASSPSGEQTVYFGEIGIFQGGVVGAAIPEPSSSSMLLGGALLALLGFQRLRVRR
ncbi:MAG: hypothetical protein Q7Q73_02880 [Verrucomicrobiota bacterium JB024]|nr:hypothetical protein [Verrucomicrobiota bacterium JB024]